MQEKRSSESGRAFSHFIRDLILILVGIGVFFLAMHLVGRALFGNSEADEIMRELSERAMDISTHMATRQQGEVQDKTAQGYPLTVYITESNFFEIVLDEVPRDLCKSLQDRWGNHITSIYVNGRLREEEEIPCHRQNQIGFEFNQNLNNRISDADKPVKKHCRSSADCDLCSDCRKGMCQSQCSAGKTCALNLNGQGVCCPMDQFDNPVCCAYTDEDTCCWGGGRCCPKDKPIRLKDGTCVSCYDQKVFAIGSPLSVEACLKVCPNREDFGTDELCMLPMCAQNQFTDRNGNCVDCLAGGSFETSEKECRRCPERGYRVGRCSLACPARSIMNEAGVCETCDSLGVITVEKGEQCQAKCPNRENVNDRCVLKTCPKGFVKNQEGGCLSCSEKGALMGVSAEMCAMCPNREMVENQCVLKCSSHSFRDVNGRCVDCADPNAIPVSPGECQRCPNRLALQNYCFSDCGRGQFRDQLGACHSCSDFESYPIQQSVSCAVCSNRSVMLSQQGEKMQAYCRLNACPLDYFADKSGGCHDCFDEQAIQFTSQEECEKCSNRFWSVNGQTCFLKQVCKPGEVLDSDGQCQACRSDVESFSVAGHSQVCDSCSNRYVYGTWCRLCPTQIQSLKTREGCLKCGGKWDNRVAQCRP